MDIYSTFFLCTPAELPAGFPGWRPPLDHSRVHQWKDPFTGEFITVKSDEPDWGDLDEEEAELEFRVLEMEGSYEDYLEQRLPPFVRDQSHWAAKDLTSSELGALIELARLDGRLRYALYAPPSVDAALQEFPVRFLPRLRELGDRGIEDLAARWAETLSSPDFALIFGVDLEVGWMTDRTRHALGRIFKLALVAADDQRLYLLNE